MTVSRCCTLSVFPVTDRFENLFFLNCNLNISNWLGASADTDAFGKALISSGLSKTTIADWSVDPRVTLPGGQKGSVFDALEDMDVDDCLAKLVEMNKLNV